MKIELSHDTIAKQVFNKASTEARTRRKVERYIQERYQAKLERGASLTQDDLDFVGPYLSVVNISAEERAFLEEEQKVLARAERRRRLLVLAAIAVLTAFSIVSFSLWQNAERQTRLAEEKTQEAIRSDSLAQLRALQAMQSDSLAQARALQAMTSDSLAQVRANDALAAQRADSLKAIELGIALSDAKRARLTAEQNAQEAKALAVAAKAKALSRAQIPTALRLVQQAWEMAPQPHSDISQTLASIFYSQQAANNLPAYPLCLASAPGKEADFGRTLYHPEGPRVRAKVVDTSIVLTAEDGTLVATLEKPDKVEYAGYTVQSADQQFFLGLSPHGNVSKSYVHFWRADGQLLQTWEMAEGLRMAFSPDNSKFLTFSSENPAQIWSLPDGKLLTTLSEPTVFDATFSADGQYIATAAAKNSAKVWNLAGKCLSTMLVSDSYLNQIKFSADGQYVVASGSKGVSYLWNWRGALLADLGEPRTWPVNMAHFTANGQEIITCADDGLVKRWRLDGLLLTTFAAHGDYAQLAVPSPDGKYIVSARDRGSLLVWRKDDQAVMAEIRPHKPTLKQVVFSPNSKTFLSCGAKNGAQLFNLRGELVHRFGEEDEWVRQVNFSPDGQQIATVHEGNTVNIWTLDGLLLATLKGHQQAITSIQFSPDGEYLLTGSEDSTAIVWRTDNGQPFSRLAGHSGELQEAIFMPDGQQILTSAGGWLQLWSLQGEKQQLINPQKTPSRKLSVSPDGRYLLTGGIKSEISLWSRQGGIWAKYPAPGRYISNINFSPDGHYILMAGQDGITRIRPTPEYIMQYLKTEAVIPELTEEQRKLYGID